MRYIFEASRGAEQQLFPILWEKSQLDPTTLDAVKSSLRSTIAKRERVARITQHSLCYLLEAGVLERSLQQAHLRPDVKPLRQWIERWARATEGTALECRMCDANVAVGIQCTSCTRAWHWGCAVTSLIGCRSSHIIPLPSRFGETRVDSFLCLLCRQGRGRTPSAKRSLLERFHTRVSALNMDAAWDLIQGSIDAGPARRRLPGNATSRGLLSGAGLLAGAAVAILSDLASNGSEVAELLTLFAPRLFMRKRETIEEQL